MKKIYIIVVVLALTVVLSGCGSETIYMQEIISSSTLMAEPSTWSSETSIDTLLQTDLPAELQASYMNLISNGCKKVIMEDTWGVKLMVNSDENGRIYLGEGKNSVFGFFRSSSGNVVEVEKVYRSLVHIEYIGEPNKTDTTIIELDYIPDNTNLIKVGATNDFSILYNYNDNTYQCMKFGEVIGTSPVTNLDAIIQSEKVSKDNDNNSSFLYNKEWYIPVISQNGDTVTFQVVKRTEFEPHADSTISYVPMQIGTLEVNACEIIY